MRWVLLAACVLLGSAAQADEALWQLVARGGHVLFVRHAETTPGVGDPPGFRLEDCATQRNLSGEGRAQARRLGEELKRRGVPVGDVLSSPWCQNQGFALGPHLGLQCHIEMTGELVRSWCATGEPEIARRPGPAVQPVARILADLDVRLAALQAVADCVYTRWLGGLKD